MCVREREVSVVCIRGDRAHFGAITRENTEVKTEEEQEPPVIRKRVLHPHS